MKRKRFLFVSVAFFAAFVIWTVLVSVLDVGAIGPDGSKVGLSGLNGHFHLLTGVNWWLYNVTDWLGLVPIAVALGFGVFGLIQWISRKSILKVDRSIIALGCFYVAVVLAYVLFEYVVINYRPVLIGGDLEASYPSSTTMLVTCVMPTAIMQLRGRIKNSALRWAVVIAIVIFIAFMVIGRLISGVHWLSDIIGGALLSIALVCGYSCFA